jgi:hypothetical protein
MRGGEVKDEQSLRRGEKLCLRFSVMVMGYVLLSDVLALRLDAPVADSVSAFAWICAGYWILPGRNKNPVEWVRTGAVGAILSLLLGAGVLNGPLALALALTVVAAGNYRPRRNGDE